MLCKHAALYPLGEQLGEGSFGVVFRTSRDGLPLIAKKFKDKNYLAEEAVLADLLRHPQIVVLRDAFQKQPNDFYLVYEDAGIDLAVLMKASSPGSLLIWGVMSQMLQGLEHIHAAGIIHADMKPQNVLVEVLSDDGWKIRIGDLGSALEARG